MRKNIPLNVYVLGLVSFFNDIASEMIYPIVPIFLTQVLRAPVFVVGLIESVAEATASFGKFIFGYLSDRFKKRKPFVVLGYGLSASAKLLMGLSFNWLLVLFSRFIDRLGKGVRTGSRDALLLQSATKKNKGLIFGLHRAFDSAGAFLGPILALILMSFFSSNLRVIFFLAFIPAFFGVILLSILVKEKKQSTDNFEKNDKKSFNLRLALTKVIKNKNLFIFFLSSFIFNLGNSSDAFLILRAKDLGLATTSAVAVYVLYNFFQTIFSTPLGSLSDRVGGRKVYLFGLLVFSLVYFLFGFINQPVFLWLIFPLYGLYIASTDGVSKAILSEYIRKEEAGSVFGFYQMITTLAIFFSSIIAGILWSKINPSAVFYYGSLTSVLAFVLLFFNSFKLKKIYGKK